MTNVTTKINLRNYLLLTYLLSTLKSKFFKILISQLVQVIDGDRIVESTPQILSQFEYIFLEEWLINALWHISITNTLICAIKSAYFILFDSLIYSSISSPRIPLCLIFIVIIKKTNKITESNLHNQFFV